MNLNILLIIILVLVYIVFLLIARIFLNKFSTIEEIFIRNNRRLSTIISIINKSFKANLESLRELKDLRQNLVLEQPALIEHNKKILLYEDQEIKHLQNRKSIRRKEACTNLSVIGSEKARISLEQALQKEKDYSVKIYISNALTDIHNNESLQIMIDTLLGSHRWYRVKAISHLLEFGNNLNPYFLRLYKTRHIEWIELFIKYAGSVFSDETKKYLFYFVDHFDTIKEEMRVIYQNIDNPLKKYKVKYLDEDMDALLTLASKTLSNFYYLDFGIEKYWNSDNEIVKHNGYWALSKGINTTNFKILLSKLSDDQYTKQIISMLTKMVEKNPRFLYLLEDAFDSEENEVTRNRIAQILSNRIEYYILQLLTKNAHRAKAILIQIIKNGRINEIIGFINLNKDLDINNKLVEIIKNEVNPHSEIGEELRTYLNPTFLEECGFSPILPIKASKVHHKDKKLSIAMSLVLAFGIFILPTIFIVRHWAYLASAGLINLLARYITEFNYVVIYYSLALTLLTLILMIFSYFNVKNQARLWNFKNLSMLFRKNMLPSISIVAPAYNEEKNIISSVKSLLNLKYPDYELIVVNDGSTDSTLNRLISTFQLIRTDYLYKTSLSTAPIRGIYRNSNLPNLVVVDKSNGGKADSLNAGINVANNEYFCGIDADSLLESEALLKLASLTLDETAETPALGGNILPINNCKVDNGQIQEIHVPNNLIARLQTVEYLRAFMIGRLGWQQIKSMLIISGAFGLFRKERIIGIGGYLTSKGIYHKDTVGEDMELVVRISRMLREMKQKFVTLYAFNANCWTEVPEDLKSLKNQRYRWQRGLVDILFYHKKMMFHKNYGVIGLIAMPYFFIFETVGPIFEFQGYLLVVLAGILGILNMNVAIMLFISAVLAGVINSLVALLIAERETQYFSIRDLSKLVVIAIAENFGPRQWISFWRVLGQFQVIFGQGGWGKVKRRGI